ncbi:MAG: diaminopimelate epimerase [Paracoccaceae bacterium]
MNASAALEPLAFRKMHGAGNDFVVVDRRGGQAPLGPRLVRAIADRRRGIGCDQLVELIDAPGSDVGLRFRNADGSASAACGNATRCVAALLLDEGRGPDLAIAVEGRGRLAARCRDDGAVEVEMGAPALDWRGVPLAREVDTLALPLDGRPTAVGMGNPHCVHVVDRLDGLDWRAIGARVERDPLFPERTNVQVVEVLSRERVRARVWERGVGRTLASGSSACAIAVACHRRGLTDAHIHVEMEGGVLEARWHAEGVALSGPVASVFEGTLSPAFLAARAEAVPA